MHLQSLKIEGWRNLKKQDIIFSPKLNYIAGENGQGKTNLLEALFFIATGFSPRTAKYEQIINLKSNFFFIHGLIIDQKQTVTVEIGMARDGRRINKVNGSVVQRVSELAGLLNAVFFMPEDLMLVKGSPSLRRRFLDMELCQLSLSYRGSLTQYNKVLKERNALLRLRQPDPVLLSILTDKLIEEGMLISKKRYEFVQRLNPLLRLASRRLSDNREEIQIVYKGTFSDHNEKGRILEQFKKLASSERLMKVTLIGPHRDDLDFCMGNILLKIFGSQGQQRTAVLALKLAEIEMFRAETGRFPLLLLDDVLSELDRLRRQALLAYMEDKIQVIITGTEFPGENIRGKLFNVQNGIIREEGVV